MSIDITNPNYIDIDGKHILLDHVQSFELSIPDGFSPSHNLIVATQNRVFSFPDPNGTKLEALRRAFRDEVSETFLKPRPYDRSRRMAVMTEKDSYLIEAALQYGFDPDPRDDGEDGEHGRYVCSGVSIVQFVRAIRKQAEDDMARREADRIKSEFAAAAKDREPERKPHPRAKVGDFETGKPEPDPKNVSPCGCDLCKAGRVEDLMVRTLGSLTTITTDRALLERVKGKPLDEVDAKWWCGLSAQQRVDERPRLAALAEALEGDPGQAIPKILKLLLSKVVKAKASKFDFSPGPFNADVARTSVEKLSVADLAIHDVEMLETYYTGGKPMGLGRMAEWLNQSDEQRMIERLRILELLAAGHTGTKG